MSKPCSQLNSKLIRDKAECNVIAKVERQCSIVGFKCVWRVRDEEIDRAWNWICEKRDECDLRLSKVNEVCFFFSAISTSKLDTKKRKSTQRQQAPRESDESNDESTINASQLSSPGKQVFPAISYWVACQTRNGSAINPLKIQSELGSCGLEIYVSRASRKKGSHDLNTLCQVLKDHKNPCLMELVQTSYQHCFSVLQEELDFSDGEFSQASQLTENVVRLRVVQDTFKQMMTKSILELRRAGLKIDTFGLDDDTAAAATETSKPSLNKPLSCPITVLCNDIQLALKKLQYITYRGDVYKKVAKAQFTFQYLCSMKTFLHNLMGNEAFKDRLVQHIQRLLPILSEPDSSLMHQLKIDKDLIEVNDGWFWSFSAGRFVTDMISESQKGVVSPRAFVNYDRTKVPEPKYFEEILRNSLSEEDLKKFCADFLALFRPKQLKQPVPCAIGAADSGKTSLFSPVFQIVPLNRIARVTKQKHFNKAMIDSHTEVIFLDEAFAGLLDADDWKLICQGGFTSHDSKWKKSQGFHCSATMYITCQVDMDFGSDHNDAMAKRLHKYNFKSLPNVKPEVNKWLRENAMDCIAWAQYIVGDNPSSEVTAPALQQEGLSEEELKNILSVSLVEESIEGSTQQPGCSREGDDQDRDSTSDVSSESETEESSTLEKLRRELHKTNNNDMRRRQLTVMLQNVESTNKAARERRLAHRRSFLVDLGVFDQTEANNAITDPDASLPGHIEQAKEKKIQERKNQRESRQRREQEEKIKQAFGNPWLVQLEKEMAEESERMEDPTDEEERKVMKSLLEINCEKLRSYHERQGTLNLAAAVEQRKRLCLSNGLVDPSCVHLIRDLYSPVPVLTFPGSQYHANTAQSSGSDCDDNDEECWSAAPKTPTYIPHDDVEAICAPSPGIAHNPAAAKSVKRPHFQSQAHPSKKQTTLTRFTQIGTQP